MKRGGTGREETKNYNVEREAEWPVVHGQGVFFCFEYGRNIAGFV